MDRRPRHTSACAPHARSSHTLAPFSRRHHHTRSRTHSPHTHDHTESSVIPKLHELHTTFPRAKRELRARLNIEVPLNVLGCLGG